MLASSWEFKASLYYINPISKGGGGMGLGLGGFLGVFDRGRASAGGLNSQQQSHVCAAPVPRGLPALPRSGRVYRGEPQHLELPLQDPRLQGLVLL